MSVLSRLEEWPVDNVAAAVLTADETVATLGDRDREFPIASVSKLITAYGVMLAVEEGAVELDGWAGPEGSTLRHLLSHASGVSFDSRESKKPVEERRIYSSAGYDWAAEAVADATGMSFADYLQEGVFAPLTMAHTTLTGSAGHGITSTVNDLVKFAQEILRPRLLDPTTVEEMREVQFPQLRGVVPGYGMQKPCPWGLGFELRGEKNPHWTGKSMPTNTAGHFGMSGTYLWVAGDYAMVALTDRDFGEWAKPLWSETNEEIWRELRGE